MHADAVVEQLDILEDRGACSIAVLERLVVGQFQLERGEETLGHRVVVGHARPAHAQPDFRFLRFCPVPRAGVLAAAVVMTTTAI